MYNLLILLHDLMSKFFLFFIAISIFLLLVQFLEKLYLCIKIFNCFIFLFNHVLQVIYLVPLQIFFLVFHLLDFFLENGILFYLVLELFLHHFQSTIDILGILFCSIFCLNFFENVVKLFIELFELRLEAFVLLLLLLDQF